MLQDGFLPWDELAHVTILRTLFYDRINEPHSGRLWVGATAAAASLTAGFLPSLEAIDPAALVRLPFASLQVNWTALFRQTLLWKCTLLAPARLVRAASL